MDPELLKIIKSGAFSTPCHECIDDSTRQRSLIAVQINRLAGLAIADQLSQRDVRIRWLQSVRRSDCYILR
jgi:hypothetical protein